MESQPVSKIRNSTNSSPSTVTPARVVKRLGARRYLTVVATFAVLILAITPAGTETVLHTFAGGADGYNPFGTLALGPKNTLYSTTLVGGTANLGVVFQVIP